VIAAMAESPMIGCRVLQDWQQQIEKIASTTGRTQEEIAEVIQNASLRLTQLEERLGK